MFTAAGGEPAITQTDGEISEQTGRHTEKTRVQAARTCAHRRAHTHFCVHKHTNDNLRTAKCTRCRLRCHLAKRSSTAGWKRRSQRECVLPGKRRKKKSFSGCFSCLFFFLAWSKGIAVPILGWARYSSRNSTASQTGSCSAGEEEVAEEFTPQPRASHR